MIATKGCITSLARNGAASSRLLASATSRSVSNHRGALHSTFQILPSSGRNNLQEQTFSFQPIRTLSTTSVVPSEKRLGTVTRTLQKLEASTVRRIEQELQEVDKNDDGRVDAEELMDLLKKHNAAFTDEEIVEFRELFYAGKAGGGLSFQDFIETLDRVSAEKNHPVLDGNCSAEYIYRKTHAKYTEDELNIELTHRPPQNLMDRMAFNAVKIVRLFFDTGTGWNNTTITKEEVLNRVIFLETIAAVPGFIAAIVRHFKSLRNMERDGGLLQLFLEEANNERMHLLSFIKMKDPGLFFRGSVIVSQAGFGSAFLASYVVSPKFCHRFVGYIEEEACTTYTKIIDAIEKAPENDELANWKTELAPKIARGYWELGENGTVLDLMYAVRADEAEHRDVNHATSELCLGKTNPYNDPNMKVTMMLRKYVKDVMSREDKLTTAN